ncbi:anti-sigma factor domain-containing protein [Pusillimonas sp.]|uniref:anti-sigma factor domain-containing protein n=1 Tax=Pusillimonas sp. TaxID=3040095 RepID=UPI0029BDB99D|nr:hypothetical protein [Pusillimonas sp.]MDX3893325.1 hypothetical protein [Pusillimonas sp.]
MTSLHHKDDFFIAEYTLGLLDPDEIAQAHSLLGADDNAVVSALQWEARLLELTDALTPLNPPGALLGRIQATLGLPRSVPAAPPRPAPESAAARPARAPAPPSSAPPASTAQSGMAMDFEPRLIRPDAASKPPEAAQAPRTARPAEPLGVATARREPPAVSDAPAPEPVRVRAAPPDPIEAFRPDAGALVPSRRAIWRSLWFWRALSAALAILAAVLVLPKDTFKHDPALSASLQPPTAPAPKIVQIAVMQAPGLSSTPGWVLTVDSRQNLVLAPQVDIVVPESESVYLWTYTEQSPHPRLLGVVDPARSLTLPVDVTGEVRPGQIFEMTQEPNIAPPQEPDGPILFIGRTVSLG